MGVAALFVGTAILFTCGFGRMWEYSSGERSHLRSATYYSDDWVIDFWNSESVHMEEELAQIAADGFNSIILAVPWREFQLETAPVMYEEYAWKKLERVMEAAGKQGLGVMSEWVIPGIMRPRSLFCPGMRDFYMIAAKSRMAFLCRTSV